MQQHEQARSAQDNHALEQAAVHEPQAAVEQQPRANAQAAPQAASFEQLTGQHGVEPQQEQKPKAEDPAAADHGTAVTDTVVEQLSHGMVAKELDDNDEKFLAAQGYRAMPIIRGQHEFVMRSFVPTAGGKPPVVAFRGTVPSKAQTVIADLDPSGIGMYQFNPNKALIEGQMQAAAAHGKVISSGHSLGGALAQIAAATFPGCVARIVTFQAPGVSREMAQKIVEHNEQHPDEAIDSSHHRVQGDLVPMGGQALTPGTIHNHQMTGGSRLSRNPLAKHVSMPLAQEERTEGHGQDLPVQGDDHGMVSTGDVSTEQDNAEKSQLIEHARTGVGHLVYGVGGVINAVGEAVRKVF